MLLHVYIHIFLLLTTTTVAVCVRTATRTRAFTKGACLHATTAHRITRNSIKKSRPPIKTDFRVAAFTFSESAVTNKLFLIAKSTPEH